MSPTKRKQRKAKRKKQVIDFFLTKDRRGNKMLRLPDVIRANDSRDPAIPRDKVGRPTIMTAQVVAKLEWAFKIGCTDAEACAFAGIHRSTLDRFFAKNPDYRDITSHWKEMIVILARATIARAVQTDPAIALAVLKKKRKEEYGEPSMFATQEKSNGTEFDFVLGVSKKAEKYEQLEMYNDKTDE